MCSYLCVLIWLMRPILALNCLLQIEQERSEEESSVGDALALLSAGHVLLGFADSFSFVFTSSSFYEATPLIWLMRPVLALNCLLQIEQEMYEEKSSVGDALALLSAGHVLLGFADSFSFVFTSSSFYEASPLCTILCNLFP